MPARAGRIVLLSALLLAPAVVAQTGGTAWDQLAGGPGRAGVAFLPSTTLDVLASRDLFGNETFIDLRYSKGLVETPHGILALAQPTEGGACVLLAVRATSVEERVLDDCEDGTLTAYDRADDRLLVCSTGGYDHAVLQARDARTGELVWALRPADLAPTDALLRWSCGGTVVGPDGSSYVALRGGEAAAAETYVARLATSDGALRWSRLLGAAMFYGGGVNFQVEDDTVSTPGGFQPFGLTLTENGLVVSGRTYCACGKGDPLRALDDVAVEQGAVAWLDAGTGRLVGAYLAEEETSALDDGVPARIYAQWWATSSGPLASITLGGRVLLINPAERDPVRDAPWEGIETGRGFHGVIPSAWWRDVIVAPLGQSLTGLDASLEPRWAWAPGAGWTVSALLVAPPSDVFVIATSLENGGTADAPAVLRRLDLQSGEELQRISLPGTFRLETGLGRVRFQPLEDGRLLVYSLDGRVVTLGPADAPSRPTVRASETYPAPGAALTLSVDAPDPSTTYTVAWGDGTVTEGGTSWTHRYGEQGAHVARITAVFADGRTATTETVVRVGATPPPSLTPLQRAFAPENQDLTFGVLGLGLTLAGAGVAVYARRRRQSRLSARLDELERIRETGRQDAARALADLGRFREGLLLAVAEGRLDDAQFNALETRGAAVFATLRQRFLGPVAGRLSADVRHTVDAVLFDGRVDDDEYADLVRALDAEAGLTTAERRRLVAAFDALRRSERA